MGYTAGAFSSRPEYQLQLSTSVASQNVAGNYSTVNWSLSIVEVSAGTSYRLNNDSTWNANIGGTGYSGTFNYDFRSASSKLLGSGSVNIGHNPDGTGSYSFSSSANCNSPLGSASNGSSEGLPTIPRSSTATLSVNPVVAGTSVTINTNRSSTSFTHTLTYNYGSQSGTIATGVADSVAWTPPLGLINETPNSTVGTGNITTTTYSGGTVIGTTTTSLSISVPASIVPDFGTITNTEATSGLAAAVGGYVQGLTTLSMGITAPVGAYGSTVTNYRIDVAGQTINTQSGTSTPILASGTVPIVGTVTDSRGRAHSETINVTVLPYAAPTIDASVFKLRRSDAAGNPLELGTYIRVDLKAIVQSLIVGGTQKNSMAYQIYVRARNTGSFVLVKTVNLAAGTTAFNSFDQVGPYGVENAWDVSVVVSDKFSSVPIQGTIATGAIFQHWGTGLGVGKFWEQGGLDVLGQIYQNNGKAVLDTDSTPTYRGTVSSTWTKYGAASVTLASGAVVLANISYVPDPGQAVLLQKVGGNYWITSPDYAFTFASLYPLRDSLSGKNGWTWYHDITGSNGNSTVYSPPIGNRTSAGFVMLDGLLICTAASTSGTVILTLPAQYRPLTRKHFLVYGGSGSVGLIVETTGDIKLTAALAINTIISLSGIQYNNDPALTRLPMTLMGAWVNTGGSDGPAQYALDATGRTLVEGSIKGGTSTSDIWTPPTSVRYTGAGSLIHSYENAASNGMARTDIPSAPIASPYNMHSQAPVSGSVTSTGRHIDFSFMKDGVGFYNMPLQNSWANYGSGWSASNMVKHTDGAVKLRGLIGSGSVGVVISYLPVSYAPKYTLIFLVDASDGLGRIDVSPDGSMQLVSGVNTFVSLESLQWMPNVRN